MDRYGLGVKGEQAAVEYLESKNYKILARNVYFHGVGELDIVAMDGQVMVFVEVRTRSDNRYGHPLETLTKAKQQKIINSARRFIYENKYRAKGYRFDVVSILNGNILHVIDAFYVR
ncbi:MAG TPA: YraN family protein [Clostridia bacterium]|nr:YraN family protein [Clostridia bacterium]